MPPLAVVLDRVGQQVQQDLLEPLQVGQHDAVAAGPVGGRERDPGPGGEGPDQGQHLGQHLGDVHPLDGRLASPASTREMSSTSLIRPSRCRPPFAICSTFSRWSAFSSSIASSWPKPRMALSGVRSSWLMRERKSLLARLAASAACLAWSSSSSARLRSVMSRCTETQCVYHPVSFATGTMLSSTQNSEPSLRRLISSTRTGCQRARAERMLSSSRPVGPRPLEDAGGLPDHLLRAWPVMRVNASLT